MTRQNKPINRGKLWTAEDREIMLDSLIADESIYDIAEKLNRTVGGVRDELYKIISYACEQGIQREKFMDEFSEKNQNNYLINEMYDDIETYYKTIKLEAKNKLLKLEIKNLRLNEELKELKDLYKTDSDTYNSDTFFQSDDESTIVEDNIKENYIFTNWK